MASTPSHARPINTADAVVTRIERGGERIWRLDDFRDLPPQAVAQALSRLARSGKLERLSKGVYFRSRATAFGRSRPNPAALVNLADGDRRVFPSGVAAASLLGLTTQSGGRAELATSAASVPRKLIGADAIVHTRRPAAWSRISPIDAALLDVLRRRGSTSELSPQQTIRKTLALLAEDGRYARLARVAATEPPRVRAILGALGERLGEPDTVVARLRSSLNPLSRFDFGMFGGLPNARSWQARPARNEQP